MQGILHAKSHAMIIKHVHLESLRHASYFIGAEETGEAFVLDIWWDVNSFLDEAVSKG